MGFETGPIPITPGYRNEVAKALIGARVKVSGLFDRVGTFANERLEIRQLRYGYDPRFMWALDLLKFAERENVIQTTGEGGLSVYSQNGHVLERNKNPIYTVDAANIRFVDCNHSFMTSVPESGWLISPAEVRHQQITDPQLTPVRLEEILIAAEVGEQPTHLDNHALFVKVDPRLAGKWVQVLRFSGVRDVVVIDIKDRCLMERSAQNLLSQEKWQPETVSFNSQLK